MSTGNSAYSPLPQSNSDSDGSSEEELQVFRGNRIVNRAAKIQNSTIEKGRDEPKNNVINYKPLDSNSDVGISLNKFQSGPDEVSILKPDTGLEVFSTSRKIFFMLSLLLCVFTTVAFIWLLPCNLDTCPSASNLKSYNFTWEENLSNLVVAVANNFIYCSVKEIGQLTFSYSSSCSEVFVKCTVQRKIFISYSDTSKWFERTIKMPELRQKVYGPISLVPDVGGSQNLIFLTSSYPDSKQNYSENGLMCLKGRDGSLKWKIKLEEPNDVDCKLIDVNIDGISDCVVLGRNNLTALNSISGEELWDLWKSNKNVGRIYFKEFPLIVPDLDGDEVRELLLSCSFPTREVGITFQNNLVIISGKTGQIINKPLQIKMCSTVKDLVFENVTTLTFTCSNSDGRESFQKISLTKLYRTVKNVKEGKPNSYERERPRQHIRDSARVRVNGFRLNLENEGDCPENCVLSIEVRDERDNSDNKTFHFSRKNTFGMAPVVLKTRKEIGFLIKFWKWHSETEKPDLQNDAVFAAQNTVVIKDVARRLIKRSKKLNHSLSDSEILDNELLSEYAQETQRLKRTAADATRHRPVRYEKGAFNSRAFSLRVITESIVKIALSNSHPHVKNVSKDEVIQICRKPGVCHPDVYRQRRSVFVADFGKDGEKLITFSTKYVHDNKNSDRNSEDWVLQSRIRALNL